MTLGFVLSKMQQILLRFRDADTLPSRGRRHSDTDAFARATVRPIYSLDQRVRLSEESS